MTGDDAALDSSNRTPPRPSDADKASDSAEPVNPAPQAALDALDERNERNERNDRRGKGRERGRGRRERKERTDDVLVRAANDGDEDAFESLLLRHEGRVLRVLRLLGIPAAEREDVAQDVFVRVFRYLDGFEAGRSFAAWVYRITVNVAHDHRTRERRRRGREAAWDDAVERTAEAPGTSTASHGDRQELRRRLERALTGLSERERAVFVLKELEGLTTRDVARTLGITAVTVRRHLGRARRSLQRILELPPEPDRGGAKIVAREDQNG